MLETQPLELIDFSGGITDKFIDAAPTKSEHIDNLLLNINNRLEQRPGGTFFLDTHGTSFAALPNAARVSGIFENTSDNRLLFASQRKLYTPWTGAGPQFHEIIGETDSNPVYQVASGDTERPCFAEWNNHIFTTNDTLACQPTKIVDEQSTPLTKYYTAITAGLPPVYTKGTYGVAALGGYNYSVANEICALANVIKGQFNAHIVRLNRHDSAQAVVTAGSASDWGALKTLVNALKTAYDLHVKTPADGGTFSTFHTAAAVAPWPYSAYLATSANVTTVGEAVALLLDLKAKYNVHEANTAIHKAVGTADTVMASFDIAEYKKILVAPIYKHTYYNKVSGTITNEQMFTDYGPVAYPYLEFYVKNTGSLEQHWFGYAGLSNNNNATPDYGRNLNYRLAATVVEVYVTELGGTEFYLFGEGVASTPTIFSLTLHNGTTGANMWKKDPASGALTNALANSPVIYTSGGVVSNDLPPVCKYLTIISGTGYYAHCKKTIEEETTPGVYTNVDYTYATRLYQSVPGDPDSVPALFYHDFDTAIKGLSVVGEVPVVFTNRGVFRVDDVYDILGNGGMQIRAIHDTITCMANAAIVRIPEGLVWLADKGEGVWYTDGYKAVRISEELVTRGALWTETNNTAIARKNRVYGTYDPSNRRVYWRVVNGTSIINMTDQLLVLELRYGLNPNSVFTTWSGDQVPAGFSDNFYHSFHPSAFIFYNGNMVRGEDYLGRIFEHKTTLTTDVRPNSGAANTWTKAPIIYRYKSASFSFGTEFLRKYITRASLSCENTGYLTIQPKSYNDNETTPSQTSIITHRTLGEYKTVHKWLRMPAQNLRCSFKALELTNAFAPIANSDTLGQQATVNQGLGTATIAGVMPTDPEGHLIYFANDNYTTGYTILTRSNNTVTYQAGVGPVNGTYKWVIKGYAKFERMHLLNVCIPYAMLGKTQGAPQAPTVGLNA